MLTKIAIFIIFLCPIVFFHELGHFIFARLFGVRVDVFSIGFGPKLFKFKKKTTEYAISLIPLGGYIKMFGDDPIKGDEIPEDEKKYSFVHKGKWARFWIVFGGPLANFILSFVILFLLSAVGEKVHKPLFGVITTESKFYELGAVPGDVLESINGERIIGITDLAEIGLAEDELVKTISVRRGKISKTLAVNIPYKIFLKEFSTVIPRLRSPKVVDIYGNIYGLTLSKQNRFSQSLEDLALEANSKFIYLYKLKEAKKWDIESKDPKTIKVSYKTPYDFIHALIKAGYYPLDLMVQSIVMKSPADKAGFKANDIVVAVDNFFVDSFEQLKRKVQSTDISKDTKILLFRDGKRIEKKLRPTITKQDHLEVKTIGVFSAADYMKMEFIHSGPKGLFASVRIAFKKTWNLIVKTLEGFGKLITNQVSLKKIGGPIAIGKVAADSFNVGLSFFFKLMAIISINLGVINLFPIPVLDGGHITFIILELLNRGPLSRRKMEIAQQFGLSLLFLLIFFTLFNDISRFF